MPDIPLVDCTGLDCPLPILHIRIKLNELRSGDRLIARCTDLSFERDLERFCLLASITLLGMNKLQAYTDYLFQVNEIPYYNPYDIKHL